MDEKVYYKYMILFFLYNVIFAMEKHDISSSSGSTICSIADNEDYKSQYNPIIDELLELENTEIELNEPYTDRTKIELKIHSFGKNFIFEKYIKSENPDIKKKFLINIDPLSKLIDTAKSLGELVFIPLQCNNAIENTLHIDIDREFIDQLPLICNIGIKDGKYIRYIHKDKLDTLLDKEVYNLDQEMIKENIDQYYTIDLTKRKSGTAISELYQQILWKKIVELYYPHELDSDHDNDQDSDHDNDQDSENSNEKGSDDVNYKNIDGIEIDKYYILDKKRNMKYSILSNSKIEILCVEALSDEYTTLHNHNGSFEHMKQFPKEMFQLWTKYGVSADKEHEEPYLTHSAFPPIKNIKNLKYYRYSMSTWIPILKPSHDNMVYMYISLFPYEVLENKYAMYFIIELDHTKNNTFRCDDAYLVVLERLSLEKRKKIADHELLWCEFIEEKKIKWKKGD